MKLFALYGDLTLATQNFNSGVEAAREQMRTMKNEMDDVQGAATKTGSILEGALGHALGDILAGVTQAAIETAFTFATEGLELASNMEETNAKIDTIFGASAANIHRWAKTTKESYGIGELSAKTYAAQVAGIISTDSKNLTSEEIESISTSLVGLAGDLASFHNMSFSETWKKLLSGLRGETEAIEDLGVDLRASNLAAEFGMTAKEWGALDQRTRLLNTYQYIMQETALAQGDFARTSDSYANQLRQMQENIEQLKLSIGESLLPVMTQLVSWFNALFGSQEDAGKSMEGITESYKESYVSIEKTTADALALVNALDALSKSADGASSTEKWAQVVGELEKTIPGLGALIGNETGTIEAGTKALQDYVMQWDATMKQLAQKKALSSMQESLYELEAEVAKLETEQWWGSIRKSGAQKAMDDLGEEVFNVMLAGMRKMGASEADIKAMEQFGASGSENLLARLANGGSIPMIMGELLAGGDLWKNKSFLEYYTKGGGTEEQLALLAAAYGEHKGTYEKYSINYEEKIAALSSQIEEMTEKYNAAVERLAEKDAESTKEDAGESKGPKGKTLQPQPLNITLNVSVDGQDVSAIIEPRVKAGVMSDINWQIQQKMKG